MSSFLCFVCHSTVNADTNEETRDKYREVIGMNLCPDSHLCFICCHVLNKMWLFKSICLKRSLEYPVLFSEKGTINLQRSDTQVGILCPEDICLQHLNSRYHFYNNTENFPAFEENKYVQLHEEMNFGLLPNNVEVQTDDIFDHFNDNLLKSVACDDNFNNDDFLVGIKENEVRKDVDEFIFGNDSIESPLENINKIELTNLEEISEVNITLTDLNVRNFVETSKEFRNNDFLAKPLEFFVKNNNFVEKSQELVRNNCYVEKLQSQEFVTNNNIVEKPHEVVRDNDFVEKQEEVATNDVFVEKAQDIVNLDKSPKLVRNIDFVEKAQELIITNDFVDKSPEAATNNDFDEQHFKNENNNVNNEFSNYNDCEINYDGEKSSPNKEVIENSFETNSGTEEIDSDDNNQQLQKPKKNTYNKIITLSLEEQKMELETNRRDKKYTEAVFKCFSCAMGFLFKDSYQAHMMRHEESNGEHMCSVCTLRFANPAVLRSHRSSHALRYQCTYCENLVKPRNRQRHACQRETITQVTCHLCGSVFPGSSHYQQHLKRAHQKKSRSYLCNICGKRCKDQGAVRTHMITHINKKFACEVCSATFSSPYTLTQHKKKHNWIQTELHYCVTCNIGYKSRKSLLAHQRNALAHKEKVYKCPVCDKTCPTLKALHSHTAAVHARAKDLFCAMCPARFSTKKCLVRHMRNHGRCKLKQLSLCHACGETFKNLKRHLKNVCEKEKDKLEEELANYYEQ